MSHLIPDRSVIALASVVSNECPCHSIALRVELKCGQESDGQAVNGDSGFIIHEMHPSSFLTFGGHELQFNFASD